VLVRKILVLAANPLGATRLQLDEQVKAIREAIQRSTKRDDFDVQTRGATTLRDLHLALLEFQPQIVHFTGHGAGKEGLQFASDTEIIYWQEQQKADDSWEATGFQREKVQAVDARTVADLLKLFADQIECVVLNACDSNHQGAAIARHIPYVISMRTAICDRAARKFSEAFYDGLGAGKDYEFSFELGKTAIQTEIADPTDLIAILKKGPALSSSQKKNSSSDSQTPKNYTKKNRSRILLEFRQEDLNDKKEQHKKLKEVINRLEEEKAFLGIIPKERRELEIKRCRESLSKIESEIEDLHNEIDKLTQ